MYDVRWLHAFEEDAPGRQVYRQATGTFALSRRPRDGFELHRDGSGEVFSGGPDDRPVESRATWTETPDGIVVVRGAGGTAFRIVKQEPTKLIVSRE